MTGSHEVEGSNPSRSTNILQSVSDLSPHKSYKSSIEIIETRQESTTNGDCTKIPFQTNAEPRVAIYAARCACLTHGRV